MIYKKLILLITFIIIPIKIFCNDGSLDTTFNPSGTNTNTPGTVITPPTTFAVGADFSEALSIAIQSDNKIIAGGDSDPGGEHSNFQLQDIIRMDH